MVDLSSRITDTTGRLSAALAVKQRQLPRAVRRHLDDGLAGVAPPTALLPGLLPGRLALSETSQCQSHQSPAHSALWTIWGSYLVENETR